MGTKSMLSERLIINTSPEVWIPIRNRDMVNLKIYERMGEDRWCCQSNTVMRNINNGGTKKSAKSAKDWTLLCLIRTRSAQLIRTKPEQ